MAKTMRAVIKSSKERGITVTEAPVPTIKNDDEVLIKVHKRAICGTDLHIYQWNAWSQNRIKTPVILGHEFYGEIVEAGRNVHTYKVGDLVTAEMHVVCNMCAMCRTGKATFANTLSYSESMGRGLRRLRRVPALNLWKVKPGIPEELRHLRPLRKRRPYGFRR